MKIIHRYLLFILLCQVTTDILCQNEGYYRRETFDLNLMKVFDILEHSPGEYISYMQGRIAYSDTTGNQINYLGTYSDAGEATLVDTIDFGDFSIAFRPDMVRYANNYYCYSGGTGNTNHVVKYNSESNETTLYYKFEDYGSWRRINSIDLIDEDRVATLFIAEFPDRYEEYILITDSIAVQDSIHIELDEKFAFTDVDKVLYSLESNSLYVLGAVAEVFGPDSFVRTFVHEYALDGTLLWEYMTPDNSYQFRPDDFFIEGDRICVAGTKYNTLIGNVILIDKSTSTMVWDREFTPKDVEGGNLSGTFYDIIKSIEGDGYILAGSMFSQVDYRSVGTLTKLSNQGDSIWMRSYALTTTPNDRNNINSIDYTSDGGYICTGPHNTLGEVLPKDSLAFGSFMLKVNSQGLLGVISDTEDTTVDTDIEIRLSPNPASDMLTIFQKTAGQVNYKIIDHQGQQMFTFSNIYGVHYSFHDVSTYPSGHYFLITQDDRGDITSLPFVVKH